MRERDSAPSHVGVLIVDDEPHFRSAAHELIEATPGFASVGLAACDEEALPLAGEREPDLLLVDMNMPGLDGIETTRQVKAAQPGVVVVLMSSDAAAIPRVEARRAGAAAVVSKQDFKPSLVRSLWEAHGTSCVPATLMSFGDVQ
jgi:two-component system, NarL family, invasion response regulator UvrY